jgi:FMN phosphatase YigB (HAD superfamily)
MPPHPITHIFFDLHGTLVDSARLTPCYALHLGRVMAERYGGRPEAWTQANLAINADWDSYFADLDLDGDEGIQDMWEGMLRTTRALFRLTGISEPDLSTVTALSRELPYLATRNCDAFYPDSRAIIEQLYEAGYSLGIATHSITAQARGTLTGAGVIDYFQAAFLCPDVTGRFQKDEQFFRSANLPFRNCLLVDDSPGSIRGAKAAGMHTILIARTAPPVNSPADFLVTGDLSGLLPYLSNQTRT